MMCFLKSEHKSCSWIHSLLLIRLIPCSSKRKSKDLSPILLELSLLFWLPRVQATIQKGRKDLYAPIVESWVILWINVTNSMVFHQVTNSRTGIWWLIKFQLLQISSKVITWLQILGLSTSRFRSGLCPTGTNPLESGERLNDPLPTVDDLESSRIGLKSVGFGLSLNHRIKLKITTSSPNFGKNHWI